MANGLSQDQLLHLARLGASQRLQELRQERQAIETLFGGDESPTIESTTPRRRRRRRSMSTAARKAVSERMKKYWAARRSQRKK